MVGRGAARRQYTSCWICCPRYKANWHRGGGDKINISKRHSSRLSLMDRLLPIPFFIEKIFMLHKIPGAILVFYDLSLDILGIF